MNLQNNPFYILNVPCSAGRREIVSASDDMCFILDSDVCLDAQNALINLNKRIIAELDWFIDVDTDTIEAIRTCIEEQKLIPTDGLSSLSRFNATLYNFSLSDENDLYMLGYTILDIDEQYSKLDIDEITEALNDNRNTANLISVKEQDVSIELNKKRDEIRKTITKKLSVLDQDSYIGLITMLAEKCIAQENYDDGVILSDIVDQYEVRLQSEIEESTEHIEAHIERIKQLVNDDAISDNINVLIRRVHKLDELAQPLQLKSQASGMPHEISEHLGIKLRNLALYLHNEKGKTKEALTLVDAMKEVFAELGNLSDLFEADSDALNELIQKDKDAKEISAEMDSLQKLSESIISFATSSNVDNFIVRVKKLDVKLKSLDLDLETKTKVRESLCYMARGTAIELHNENQQTSYAVRIAEALVEEFGDMPSLSVKLNVDSLTLSLNSIQSRSYSSSSSSKSINYGYLIRIAVVLIIIIAIAVSGGSNYSKSSSSPSSSTYSSGSAASTETKFSRSSTSGTKVYADIVSIWPEFGIYTHGSSNYHHFVCKCKTSSGSTFWVYMTVSEYKNNFDSSTSTSINRNYAKTITFNPSKRVHGIAKEAETIISGLSSDTGTMVIDFSSND